jgi:hypothetical protein
MPENNLTFKNHHATPIETKSNDKEENLNKIF